MANQDRRNRKGRSKARRNSAGIGRAEMILPRFEWLEERRLLAVAINEFGGAVGVLNPAGITQGDDGNLWLTEANPTAGAIARVTPSGAIQNYSTGLTPGASPTSIASGPDGALWFTEPGVDKIGRIDTSGNITEFPLPTPNAEPEQITSGNDGALWFTETAANKIGRIDTSGVVTEFAVPTANSRPLGIASGGEPFLSFTESAGNKIGRITYSGQITEIAIPTAASGAAGIIHDFGSSYWFTEQTADKIGQITAKGVVTEYTMGLSSGAKPQNITTGDDGRLWFTEEGIGMVGAIDSTGNTTEYSDPALQPTDAPLGITTGPDGNLWFTTFFGNHVDRVLTGGIITQFPSAVTVPPNAFPNGITEGPDNALWFTETSGNEIGRVDTTGQVTRFSAGISSGAAPSQIALGPIPVKGGTPSLWFTEAGTNTIGEISTSGQVSEFGGLTSGGVPGGITLGPDGNLWFTDSPPGSAFTLGGTLPAIFSMNSAGQVVQDFSLPAQFSTYQANDIVTGPDGALWFTMNSLTDGEIGRVTTAGVFSFFPIPSNTALGYTSSPMGIVAGTNQNLWFADTGNHAIGEITTAGVIQEFTQGLSIADVPEGITAGADGNFWFTDPIPGVDSIGQITPQGVITLFQTPTIPSGPLGIAAGPDNNIWFTESAANQIGQAVLAQSITAPMGTPATVYATILQGFGVANFNDNSMGTNSTNFTANVANGDGTSESAFISPDAFTFGRFYVFGFNTFKTVGVYTTQVTLGTQAGNTQAFPVQVTAISPITLTGQNVDGIAGRRTNTLVATFTDQDPSAVAGDFTAMIDWADGTSSQATVTAAPSSTGVLTFAIYAGHTFAGPGSFVNNIALTDNRNGLTAGCMSTATVAAAPGFAAINEVGPVALTPGAGATGITLGPDMALWFTETNSGDIGRIDTSGAVTEFRPTGASGNGFTPNSGPTGITRGPDGALWFTETSVSQIARITTGGGVTEFSSGITPGAEPDSIVTGPDGNLWFTEFGANAIGRITPTGVITEFPLNLAGNYEPDSITSGPDGNLWFVGLGSGLIGRITPQGVISVFEGNTTTGSTSITQGPDGDLWYTESFNNKIAKINPTTSLVTEYTDPTVTSPASIISGPDGALYFTAGGNTIHVGRITTSGVISSISTGITANSSLAGIAMGPDDNVYFDETAGDRIGQVVLPQSSVGSLVAPPINPVATKAFSGILATFTEASTIPTTANFDAIINWGDGTSTDLVATVGSNGEFSVPGSHTYANPGPYAGSVTIFNDAGLQTVQFLVNVAPIISVTGIPITVPANRTFTLPVATFIDADGPRPPGSYDLIIQWGDGTTSTGTLGMSAAGLLEVIGTHDYPVAGSYQVGVIVDVKSNPSLVGGSLAVATVGIPYLTVYSIPVHATAGNLFRGVVATLADTSPEFMSDPTNVSFGALIDWGDGTPATSGTIDTNFAVSGSHVYARTGSYTVTVAAFDLETNDHGVGQAVAQIEVAGPIDEVKAGISGNPGSITSGPDGALWFTESIPSAISSPTPGIGRITTGGQVTNFTAGLPAGAELITITSGPDGNLWFTQDFPSAIGRITPQGVITEFTQGLNSSSGVDGITTGPDGNLWFTEPGSGGPLGLNGAVGRITPQGVITEFQQGLASGSSPGAITLGPDGNLWFADGVTGLNFAFSNNIGRITPQGVITIFQLNLFVGSEYAIPSITSGPDGALWFTEALVASFPQGSTEARIGRITTTGAVTYFSDGFSPDSVPEGITTGPDGNLWFVDEGTNHADRITTAGEISTFAIPSGNSGATSITLGSDDNLWFNEPSYGQIGQVILPESVVSMGASLQGVVNQPLTNADFADFADKSSLVDLNRFFLPTINFGDMSFASGTLTNRGNGVYPLIATHTYATATNFIGAATLSDVIGTSAPAYFTASITSGMMPPSFVVTNTNDSGPGSLRQVILDANSVGGHVISFAIPARGVATIVVTSPLPAISGPTVIDGPSQGRFEGIITAQPLVEIDGRGTDSGIYDGLIFAGNSAGSYVLSLSIFGFAGAQVALAAPNVTLFSNILGLRAGGSPVVPPQGVPPFGAANDGVAVFAPGAVIGGPFPNQGNVISGNAGWGVLLAGPSAYLAHVVGNRIGLDLTGDFPLGNRFDGIAVIAGAGHEFIGPGNDLSGNAGDGLDLVGSSTDLIVGNFIGTVASGSRPIPNGNDGIAVDGASSLIVIGGTDPFLGNLISGNHSVGVAVLNGSSGVVLESNLIGTDSSGEFAMGNGIAGVLVSNSPGNVVGPGNLVSGNGTISQGAGIWIDGSGSKFNQVFGNKVGLDLSGEFALGNAIIGILVDEASDNEIGGIAFGSTNFVSGNTSIGVMIAGPGASGNLVAGNLIGTDIRGTKAVGNGTSTQGAGVYIDDASGNAIGDVAVGPGNLISGNPFDGVQVFGPSSTGTFIEGNRVGTDLFGTSRLGNGEDGLLINGAPGTQIVSNVVAANALDGITVSGPQSSGTLIQANLIGRGVGGQSLGNGTFGILVVNGAPLPIQVGNVNVNNTDGPIRDTSLAAASVSTSAVSTSSTAAVGKKVAIVHGHAKPSGPRVSHPRSKAPTVKPKSKR